MARRRRQGFSSKQQPAAAVPSTTAPTTAGRTSSEARQPAGGSSPSHPAASDEQRALALIQQGALADAERLLLQLIAAGTRQASVYCNLAAIHGMRGRTGAMIDLLEQALKLRPEYPEALSNLGIAYQESGQKQKAIRAYRKALRLRPDYPEALCNLGSALQDGGDLDAAIEAYRKAIASKPDYPEACTNLGLALHKKGDLALAIEAFRQALALRPDHLEALIGLGQVQRERGETDLALQTCRQALALQPGRADLHSNLAGLLKSQGDLEGAAAHFSRALELRPESPEVLVNLGDLRKQQGLYPEAIGCFQQALSLRPDFPEALSNLGIVHQMCDDIPAAIAAYRRAIALDPDFAPAHSNLGISLSEQGDFAAAVEAFRAAIRLEPDFAEAHSNLGIALEESGQLEASLQAYRQALQLQPDYPEAHCNLGNALQENGEIEASIASYRKALELRPDYSDALKNLSMALLLSGDYQQGWLAYEARFHSQKGQTILNAVPCSEPSAALPPPGQPLLLVSEQGYGDTLQFMRYVHPLRERGLQVQLCAPPKLHSLIQASGIDAAPLHPEQVHGRHDGPWLPLLSVPRLLGVSASQPLVSEAYLRTSEALHRKWQALLADAPRPIIALNWQGNPEHEKSTSKGRSLPLECFAPLARIAGISLLSLQKGHGSEQLEGCSFRDRFVDCQELVSDTWDFLETAAMIANCDLVITSDTSVAHLAAGLGQTTWLLLKHIPEWRWGLEGEDSFWYPSMRLFRQRRPGDWDELLERVAVALQQTSLAGPLAPPPPADPAVVIPPVQPVTSGENPATQSFAPFLATPFHAAATLTTPPLAAPSSHPTSSPQANGAPISRDAEQLQRLLQQGRLGEVEQLCRQWLAGGGADAQALQPLALGTLASLCEAGGRWQEQFDWLRQLVSLSPESAAAHYNLAVALQQRAGDDAGMAAAITAYRQALSLQPDFPEALGNLGVALQGQGQTLEAIELLRRAVQLRPDFAEGFSNLGNACQAHGLIQEAIEAYRRALELRPDFAECLSNLATALKDHKQLDEAETACRRALALRPDYPEALSNLGNVLQAKGDPAAAIDCYRQALALRPDYANARYNLGIALKEQDDIAGAIASYQAAIALQPNYPNAHSNLGNAWQELGALDKAIAAYETALSHDENHPGANKNLSMALLLKGDYDRGWPRYEWRFEDEPGLDLLFARPSLPRWDGSPLPAGTALTLVGEQGLGDVLQFMRYALPLRQQGIAVSLCAVNKLHGLIQASGIDAAPLTPSQAMQRRDGLWIPLLSLPQHLGVSRENPVVSGPYIHTTPAQLERWRQILAAEGGPIIGLNWQGNPEHEKTNSRGRSLPLEAFAPLAKLAGVRFLSLQKGHGSEQLDTCSFRDRFVGCQDLVSEAWDFEETAAILACCDLVISSDTSVVHLAGGMDVPTWVLLKDVPEWRWGLQGDTSFWYPSMRLFRQRRRGDWHELMQRVLQALEQRLGCSDTAVSRSALAPADLPAASDPAAGHPAKDKPTADESASEAPTRRRRRRTSAEAPERPHQPRSTSAHMASPAPARPAANAPTPAGHSYAALVEQGLVCQERGDHQAAIAAYRQALVLQPQGAEALSNLGLALQACGDHQAAIGCFQEALALQPPQAAAIHYNLGNAHQQLGAPEQAIRSYREALTLREAYPRAHNNLAVCLQELGRLPEAIAAYRRALALDPAYHDARTSLAMALLLSADYQAGWPLYNQRFAKRQNRQLLIARPAGPLWQGEALSPSDRLLLVAEQGLGDTLQFMRYLPALRRQGFAASLCAEPKLHGLIRDAGLDPQPLSPEQANADSASAWLPLLSLPQHLGVNPANPLENGPYLRCNEALVQRWRQRLAGEPRPLIALHWQGNPDHETTLSRGRSLPLEAFAPLAGLPALSLVALQKGPGSEQLAACSFRDRFVSCQEQVSDTWDFQETAAILASCDLVISSDSALAHLAAGLGRPTWLLLKDVPEWRWGLQGESSFWYPSMRLFRQAQRGNWTELMQRVLLALQLHLGCATRPQVGPDQAWGNIPPLAAVAARPELTPAAGAGKASQPAALPTQPRASSEAADHSAATTRRDGATLDTGRRMTGSAGDWQPAQQAPRTTTPRQSITPQNGITPQPSPAPQRSNTPLPGATPLQSATPLRSVTPQPSPAAEHGAAPPLSDTAQQSATPLQQAEQLFAERRWPEAEVLYRQLVASGGDAHLFNRLGQLCGLGGRFEEMAQWLERGLALWPEDPGALANLALAYQEQGQLQAALRTYARSLTLRPEAADVLTNRGSLWQAIGDLQAALDDYRRALSLDPQHAEAHCNLGLALQQQGDIVGARAAYRQALALRPDFTKAQFNLGCLENEAGQGEAAAAAFRQVIRLDPGFPGVYTCLGNACKRQGDLETSIAAYRQGLARQPEDADALCNLGNSHLLLGDLSAALECFQRALAVSPAHAKAHHNRAIALQEQGDLPAAIAAFRQSLQYEPDFAEAHGALAMALLLSGDYQQGWPEYEWRFQCQHGPHLLTARPDLPRWDGQPLAPGSPLLLVSEQGLGDTLQFLRYGLHLQKQGVQVHLCAPGKLHGLIQLSGLEMPPLTPEQATQLTVETLPQAQWLPLLSLPGLLGVTPESPLVSDPYLRSCEERIKLWRQRLAGEQRPIVAIHWQGNSEHEQTTSMGRSLPLEVFAPLARIEGVSLLSLQKGHGSEQLESCSFRHRFVRCQDQVSDTWDFVDTAAIVANCDLVITSDTALAHLAAGMGQPTWLLLKHTPEWRWGLEGDRSFWYPSLRLFRQRSRGDWAEVMERVVGRMMVELERTAPDGRDSGCTTPCPQPGGAVEDSAPHGSAESVHPLATVISSRALVDADVRRHVPSLHVKDGQVEPIQRALLPLTQLAIPTLTQYELVNRLCLKLVNTQQETRIQTITILDNGGNLLESAYGRQLSDLAPRVQIITPSHNLGVAGSWNYFARHIGRCIISNDDALFDHDVAQAFEAAATRHSHSILLENDHPTQGFSTFLLNRPDQWLAMGGFDEMFNPAYFEDNDARRRLALAGNPVIRVRLDQWQHINSSTLANSSKEYQRMHWCLFNRNRAYYRLKWGGDPGEEIFSIPFNL